MKFSIRDFIHPEDEAALNNLKAIPGFAALAKTVMKHYNEALLRGLNMAEKIRLGPRQMPKVYNLLPPICERLGIEVPELYLENGMPNAYTYGDTRVFITVTSGLLFSMEEDELRAVLAHECGHIACQHTLYNTVARLLLGTSSMLFKPLQLLTEPIRLGLLYWSRRSELSADRAAAVALGDPLPLAQAMVRLCGGPRCVTGEVDIEQYAAQAEAYDHLLESKWDSFLQNLVVMNYDHPMPAVRTRELLNWGKTPVFQQLAAVAHQSAEPAAEGCCPACRRPVRDGAKFCVYCGGILCIQPTPAI